jgi:hypothetical protein
MGKTKVLVEYGAPLGVGAAVVVTAAGAVVGAAVVIGTATVVGADAGTARRELLLSVPHAATDAAATARTSR